LGSVTDSAGVTFDFHATAILNGSRQIAPGTDVSFMVAPGHRGRYEARTIDPLRASGAG
jgi:cold shock CspA family protein